MQNLIIPISLNGLTSILPLCCIAHLKIVKAQSEKIKISIRNIRRDANDELKKLLKSKEISEDEEKSFQKKIQDITDKHITTVDSRVASKEKEIMTI